MTTPTTNFAWGKPIIGADSDTWGTEINALADAIDALLGSGAGGGALNPLSIKFGTGATLSDYREGTWVPADNSGAGLAFTVTSALYRKIGKLVYVELQLTFPVTANGASVSISGLPFAANADAYLYAVRNNSSGTAAISSGATTFATLNTAGANDSNAGLSGAALRISGCYPTAA